MGLRREQVPQLLKSIAQHPHLRGATWQPLAVDIEELPSLIGELLTPYRELLARQEQILIALGEARGNACRHGSDDAGGLCVVGRRAQPHPTLDFLIADGGKGFTLRGERPPYPSSMIGHAYVYRRVLGGTVLCRVAEENVLEIDLEPPDDEDVGFDTDDLPTDGMGLSIIAKVMNRVVYLTAVGPGNVLWLQLRLPAEEPS